jgi:hypothetical protein
MRAALAAGVAFVTNRAPGRRQLDRDATDQVVFTAGTTSG